MGTAKGEPAPIQLLREYPTEWAIYTDDTENPPCLLSRTEVNSSRFSPNLAGRTTDDVQRSG
jgi:hypothetical protein